MLKGLLRLLNVEKGEEKPVLLLLGNGFFLGIFLASYKSVAYTLFLENLGEYLREAMFMSGGLGVISTGIYAFIQRRIPFSNLILLNYIFIFLFIAASRIMFVYADAEWVIFVLFVMHAPILSVLLLTFWGTFGRIFNLRQSKRIIGGIDTGQLVATIIAFFSIPFISQLLGHVSDLLIIGEVGMVLSTVFLVIIISNFKLNAFDIHRSQESKETKFTSLVRNRYVVFLALFLFMSMLAFSLVEYSFLSVAELKYPDQNKLLSFISTIEGSVLVIGLLVQTFVNERLISMYGLRTTLLVLPVILSIFTALALFTGYYFGFNITDTNFIWFFLFITISKLFSSSLREAMENPVFKLFFMPLDDKVRFDIQTKVEGMVNEFARLFGGAIIFTLGLIPFIELIHYSILLLIIIGIWVVFAMRVYQNYRVNIRLKLERQKRSAGREITKHSKNYIFNVLIESSKKGSPEKLIFAFKVIAKLFPFEFKTTFEKSIKSKDKDIRNFLISKLKEDNIIGESDFKSDNGKTDEEVIDHDYLAEQDVDFIIKLVKNAKHDQKKIIADFISHANPTEGFKILIELLNDPDTEIINQAILAAGNIKKIELLPFLVDFLTQERFRDAATDSLISYGQVAFASLETSFFATDQIENVKLRIVGIYGRVGGDEAIDLLWNKIDYPDFQVVFAVINSLSQCGFKAHGSQITRIKTALENDISNILWNLVALDKLRDQNDGKYDILIDALNEENEHNYTHIYMLMSMIFDQKSIQLVKENIESKTNEGTTYALELLDVFLPEDIKQKIIPILDDIPDNERVKRLQIYFPQLELKVSEVLRAIVNRDFSQTNRWTKACSFYSIGVSDFDADYSLELIANLFNPDELMQETAAWVLHKKSPEMYRKNITRLNEKTQLKLNNKILDSFKEEDIHDLSSRYLKYDLVEFLKHSSTLKGLTGLFLSRLVDSLEELEVNRDFEIDLVNYKTNHFFFVLRGRVILYDNNGNIDKEFFEGGYLGEFIFSSQKPKGYRLVITAGTHLLQIDKNRFYDLVCDDYEIAERILDMMDVEQDKKSKIEYS